MTKQEIALTPVFQPGETVAYYKPKEPVIAANRKPYFDGGRVVTVVPTKEFQVMYATQHENPEIQSAYEEFKLTDDKAHWLRQNSDRLKPFNINVAALIEMWSSKND